MIPSLVKGGFIVGAQHGRGIMSVRDRETNKWSAPGFVALTGGSIGWQIGVQAVDLVLLVMNREGVKDLLDNEFKLGANASVAAGPVGRQGEASTDASLSAQILAYSRAKGLFAGLALEGASLRIDRDAIERLYGRSISKDEMVRGISITTPGGSLWTAALARLIPPGSTSSLTLSTAAAWMRARNAGAACAHRRISQCGLRGTSLARFCRVLHRVVCVTCTSL